MTLIATKNVSLVGKNGRRFSLVLGQTLTKAQANNLSPRQVREFTREKVGRQVAYNHDERVVILEAYVATGNRQEVADRFMSVFPGTSHSVASLNRMCGQLECLDVQHPNSTNHVVSQALAKLAADTYPDRFMSSPLEVMLAGVSVADLVNATPEELQEALALAS